MQLTNWVVFAVRSILKMAILYCLLFNIRAKQIQGISWTVRALANLKGLHTISKIFILITFRPHKFNIVKVRYVF